MLPCIDKLKIVDIKPQILDVPLSFFSRDQYRFSGDIAIFYNVNDPKDVALMPPSDIRTYIERYINLELRDELSHVFSLIDHLDEQNPRHLVLDSVDTIKDMFEQRGLNLYDIGIVILPPPEIPEFHMRRIGAEYERITAPIEAEAYARGYTIERTAERENRLAEFRGIMGELRNIDGPTQYLIAMGLFGRNQPGGQGYTPQQGVQDGIGDNLYSQLVGDENLAQVAIRRGLGQNGIAVFSLSDLLSRRTGI